MRTLALIVISMALLASMVVAQPLDKYELTFSAGYAKLTDGDDGMSVTFALGEAGKMINENIELQAGLAYANLGGLGNVWAIAPSACYYFNKQGEATGFVPYVGAGFFWDRFAAGDDSDSNTGFLWMIGAKSFLGQNPAEADRAIFIEYRSMMGVVDLGGGDDIDLNTLLIGISNYF